MALNAIQRAIVAKKPKAPSAPTEQTDTGSLDPYGEPIKQKVSELTAPGEQKQREALDKRFYQLEQKLFGQELGQAERESDILARKFARIGPTGREEKAMEVAGKAAGRRLQEGQETISQEKMAQQEALQQTLEGRRLQAAERLAGQEFTTTERQAGETFTAQQNELDRGLISQQIDIAEKELDINLAVSLSNLAQVEDPAVMEAIINTLKDAGVDMSYFESLPEKLRAQGGKPAEPASTVDTSKPAGQAPEIQQTSPGGVALPGTSGELINFGDLGQAPTIENGGIPVQEKKIFQPTNISGLEGYQGETRTINVGGRQLTIPKEAQLVKILNKNYISFGGKLYKSF